MLRWLIARLLTELRPPESERVALVRRLGEQLSDGAGKLRETALRARTLSARVDFLSAQVAAWERRIDRASKISDPNVMVAAAKMAGRVGGQLEAARAELADKLDAEFALREILIENRKHFFRLATNLERDGYDASSCMTTIDLSRPPPTDDDGLPDDEEADFVAQLIDRARADQ
jgi:hypothetical protein